MGGLRQSHWQCFPFCFFAIISSRSPFYIYTLYIYICIYMVYVNDNTITSGHEISRLLINLWVANIEWKLFASRVNHRKRRALNSNNNTNIAFFICFVMRVNKCKCLFDDGCISFARHARTVNVHIQIRQRCWFHGTLHLRRYAKPFRSKTMSGRCTCNNQTVACFIWCD